jgi:tetratricopeptide (TPR) repeat protein
MTVTGRTEEAIEAAKQAEQNVFIAKQLVADRRWHDVLTVPYAKGQSDTIAFVRGIAFAQLGDAKSAEQSLAEMPKAPPDSPSWVQTVTAMQLTLQANIAMARGDAVQEVALLQRACASADKGDRLTYAEFPAMYYYSPHLALADIAMRLRRLELAKQALQAELAMNPKSPIALRKLAQVQNLSASP